MSDIHKNSNNIKTNIQNIFLPALTKLRKGGDEVLSFGEEKCKCMILLSFTMLCLQVKSNSKLKCVLR